MTETSKDAKIQLYLMQHGETDAMTIGRALGREFGWKTVADVENAIKYVDGVSFRVVENGVLWSYDFKRSRLLRPDR